MKPVVYIASPYSKGDPAINTHVQCAVFDQMLTDGIVVPYVPLWSHFQHTLFPRHYQDWIEYDLSILHKFDACYRMLAEVNRGKLSYRVSESSGADGEVARFVADGKPVFYSLDELYDWAKSWDGVVIGV